MAEQIGYDSIGTFAGARRENNVIYFLHKHAQVFTQRTAISWIDRKHISGISGAQQMQQQSINYGDFTRKINSVALGLKNLGIAKGDRVIIFLPLSVELYLCMFAVQWVGAIAVFLDSWARRDQLGLSAGVVAPKAMISFEKAFDLCQAVPELSSIAIKIAAGEHGKGYEADLEGLLLNAGECAIEPVEAADTALITFTTGSSGVPKGADRTHRFLAAQHRALDQVIPYQADDRDLPVFPIFSLNNLAGGVTTVLPAIDLAVPSDKDAATIVKQIFSARITCCTVSPSIFVNVTDYCRANNLILGSLRRVVTGGAAVSRDNVKNFKAIAPQAKILVLYGSTEVEPIAEIEADEMLSAEENRQGVNVGRIFEGLEYKFIKIRRKNVVLGEQGWKEWETGPNKPGELVVSGDHVCENYYNNPEAFNSAKIRDADQKIWHRTGDVGMLDEQKRLWLVGRVHNTIIRNNEYLFPVHAEILLKRLDFVRQAAFLGIEDPGLGEKTCAIFSLKEGFSPEAIGQFKNAIAAVFSENKIPLDEIVMVKDIPMDPRHHSKVEYARLKEMILSNG